MRSFSIFPIVLLLFIGWIVLATTPEARMERVCKPTDWLGNVAVSLTMLVSDKQSERVQDAFDGLNYSCRFSVWRLFYEKEYLEDQEKKDGEAVQGQKDDSGTN